MGGPEENHEPYADYYVPADHDYGQPGREKIHDCQSNIRRGVEQFVGRRVKISPQNRFLFQQPGQEPIDGIADRGGDERKEGPAIKVVEKEDNKQWNTKNPAYAQKIRDIHHIIRVTGRREISLLQALLRTTRLSLSVSAWPAANSRSTGKIIKYFR